MCETKEHNHSEDNTSAPHDDLNIARLLVDLIKLGPRFTFCKVHRLQLFDAHQHLVIEYKMQSVFVGVFAYHLSLTPHPV